MDDRSELSALRERVGRLEVTQSYQADQLNGCDEQMKTLSAQSAGLGQRISDIEQLLKIMHQVTRWGLASVGTLMLEVMTGALRAILKMLATLGNG